MADANASSVPQSCKWRWPTNTWHVASEAHCHGNSSARCEGRGGRAGDCESRASYVLQRGDLFIETARTGSVVEHPDAGPLRLCDQQHGKVRKIGERGGGLRRFGETGASALANLHGLGTTAMSSNHGRSLLDMGKGGCRAPLQQQRGQKGMPPNRPWHPGSGLPIW